ncbi:MAG: hypothetical protein IPM33_00330 [Phycisphaerales bacterium]|nr:hypothetical protein [Phycisphaerales bacterium]
MQYDTNRRATWPLQDAGGDVVALCDLGGANGAARVLTQIVYDAYGRVIGRDDPATPSTGPPELRVGHKGLFFDRLDAGIFDVTLGRETPRLAPGARLSGYARNRTLHSDFGRWNQPDPNATGLPVQTAIAFHGGGLAASTQKFDLKTHYEDGVNVFGYLKGKLLTERDPLGLITLGGLAANIGIQAMIGGVTAVGLSMLFHDSYQDKNTNVGKVFLAGALGGAVFGAVGGGFAYFFPQRAVAGEIGAGGRMLADDVYLQVSLGQTGRFAGSQTGTISGQITTSAQRLEYAVQYTWKGTTLKLEPALYPMGAKTAQIGTTEMRTLIRQLEAEGYESGATQVIISYQRMGSTGGPYGRPVEWPFTR